MKALLQENLFVSGSGTNNHLKAAISFALSAVQNSSIDMYAYGDLNNEKHYMCAVNKNLIENKHTLFCARITINTHTTER